MILISSTLMIGLIGFVFSIIVKNAVTRHLSHISDETSQPVQLTSKTYKPIVLSRPEYDDEISDLVRALNRGRKQVAEFALAKESYEDQLEYQANFDMLTNYTVELRSVTGQLIWSQQLENAESSFVYRY